MPLGVWGLGPSLEPTSQGLGSPSAAGLATVGQRISGERPRPPSLPPVGSRSAPDPLFPPPPLPQTPQPLAAKPGDCLASLSAPRNRFLVSALGPLQLCSLLPGTFGARLQGGALGVRRRRPSQPILYSSLTEARGEVWGGGHVPTQDSTASSGPGTLP